MWVGLKYLKGQMKCTQELRWRFPLDVGEV